MVMDGYSDVEVRSVNLAYSKVIVPVPPNMKSHQSTVSVPLLRCLLRWHKSARLKQVLVETSSLLTRPKAWKSQFCKLHRKRSRVNRNQDSWDACGRWGRRV